jgi:hypothetical protein
MSPFKAAILDMIKAAPNGISSAELRDHLYSPQAARERSLIRVHIHRLNELLSETDWLIASDPPAGRGARWFLHRRKGNGSLVQGHARDRLSAIPRQ